MSKTVIAPYALGETWEVKSQLDVFGHEVKVHQNGSAVILEIDGLCIVGDVGESGDKPVMVFPRALALCPTLSDAQRAVELAFQRTQR